MSNKVNKFNFDYPYGKYANDYKKHYHTNKKKIDKEEFL